MTDCPVNLNECKVYCNDSQIYPAMKYYVEECGLPIRKSAKKVSKETGGVITPGSARLVYQRRTEVGTYVPPQKPNKKHDACATSDLSRLVESGKKFGTIYADPPWKYSNQGTRSSTDNHYTTMTVEEIAELPIRYLTIPNAHLQLWTTNAFLFDSLRIIESWGFEYKSCFVWVKPQMGIGNYWRVSHEFLLLGVKGSCPFFEKSNMSWMELDRTKHSRKPEEIAQIIERVSPGPYLELFGRRTRPNWTVWGNEIERDLFNESAFEP